MLVSKRPTTSGLTILLIFETIIALAFMTYIINLDAYKLHMVDEKIFNDFMINDGIFHLTKERG